MKLTGFITAASLAIFAPFAASAATVTDSDYTDMIDTDGATDLSLGPLFTFQEEFTGALTNQVVVLDFYNDLGQLANLHASVSVNPEGSGDEFGFGTDLSDITGFGANFWASVAAGDTISFYSRLGDVPAGAVYDLDIQFTVTEVPVPAAGFLLIGALGGLLAVRRRKA